MARKKTTGAGQSDPADEISIEAAMEELGAIVTQLEAGQASLDESLQQFERGLSLLRVCHRKLDVAAQRIDIVTRMTDGEDIETAEFDATSTLQKSQRSASGAESSADAERPGAGGLF